jgi:hypothetical protein
VHRASPAPGRTSAPQPPQRPRADLPDDARQLILGENLKRLLKPILDAKGVRI